MFIARLPLFYPGDQIGAGDARGASRLRGSLLSISLYRVLDDGEASAGLSRSFRGGRRLAGVGGPQGCQQHRSSQRAHCLTIDRSATQHTISFAKSRLPYWIRSQE